MYPPFYASTQTLKKFAVPALTPVPWHLSVLPVQDLIVILYLSCGLKDLYFSFLI